VEPLLAVATWPELPLGAAGRAHLQPAIIGFANPRNQAAAAAALHLRLLAWRLLGALCAADGAVMRRTHGAGWTRVLAAWASGQGAHPTTNPTHASGTSSGGGGSTRQHEAGCSHPCGHGMDSLQDPSSGPVQLAAGRWSVVQTRALQRAALSMLSSLAACSPQVHPHDYTPN